MFAGRPLPTHLFRGALAAALTALAIWLQGDRPYLALGFAGGALLALRGCPVCWLIGLVQAMRAPSGRSRRCRPFSDTW
jgi:hypothetical protein